MILMHRASDWHAFVYEMCEYEHARHKIFAFEQANQSFVRRIEQYLNSKFISSFGGARDFEIRSANASSNLPPLSVRLHHGQLLAMNGYFQEEFEHRYSFPSFFDDSQDL